MPSDDITQMQIHYRSEPQHVQLAVGKSIHANSQHSTYLLPVQISVCQFIAANMCLAGPHRMLSNNIRCLVLHTQNRQTHFPNTQFRSNAEVMLGKGQMHTQRTERKRADLTFSRRRISRTVCVCNIHKSVMIKLWSQVCVCSSKAIEKRPV